MTWDENFMLALDGLEKSLLWRSVSMILKKGHTSCTADDSSLPSKFSSVASPSTLSYFTKLISSKECRKPLCVLLSQLGYDDLGSSSSLVARKLLSSIILLFYYDQTSEDPSSENELLLAELKIVSKRLWQSLKCALQISPPHDQRLEVDDLHDTRESSTFKLLKSEIDSYLILFDKWKNSDLIALHSSISNELDSVEKLKISTNGSSEWSESLDSYCSLLETTKNAIPQNTINLIEDGGNSKASNKESSFHGHSSTNGKVDYLIQSIPNQIKSNQLLSRAQTLYEIIIQGANGFISKKCINKGKYFILLNEEKKQAERLVRLRTFHSNALRRIKKALLEIATIGEATLKWTNHQPGKSHSSNEKDEYQEQTLASLIEKDFANIENNISLKELIVSLQKTLAWLTFIISIKDSLNSATLAEDIKILSNSLEMFYDEQSAPAVQINALIVAERKSFLLTFYVNLDNLLQRTFSYALEHAVTSLVLPFISEKKHLREYFDTAYASISSSFIKEDLSVVDNIRGLFEKSLCMTEIEVMTILPHSLWLDHQFIRSINSSINNWAFFISTFVLVKEYLNIESNDLLAETFSFIIKKMENTANPLEVIFDEWTAFCKKNSSNITDEQALLEPLKLQKEQHPVIKIFSKRIREAVLESGINIYQAVWDSTNNNCANNKIPISMHTGKALISKQCQPLKGSSGWWNQWNSFFTAINGYQTQMKNYDNCNVLHIHPSLFLPGDVVKEEFIFPTSLEIAKRICFYQILHSQSPI